MSKNEFISQIDKNYEGRHLPGCDCMLTPLNEAGCRCIGPERYLIISSYVDDLFEELENPKVISLRK